MPFRDYSQGAKLYKFVILFHALAGIISVMETCWKFKIYVISRQARALSARQFAEELKFQNKLIEKDYAKALSPANYYFSCVQM